MPKKNVILLSKHLSIDPNSSWLTDDLVSQLLDDGFNVDIILLDLKGTWVGHDFEGSRSERVFSFSVVGSHFLAKSLSFLFAYIRMLFFVMFSKKLVKSELLIGFSIATPFLFIPRILRSRGLIGRSTLILWDFFPIHQYQIGKLRSKIFERILRVSERSAINEFDDVALMSEMNRKFFLNYYPKFSGETLIIPVWGRDPASVTYESLRGEENFSCDKLHCIFGGQITKGRGIDTLLKLGLEIDRLGYPILIHIFGDGDQLTTVEDVISSKAIKSIHCYGSVSRNTYSSYLKLADVGMVITVSGVTVPTFPSKVIDYFRAKLPVIACVEQSTDFGEVVEQIARAGLKAPVDNVPEILAKLNSMYRLKLEGELSGMGQRGFDFFYREMHVKNVTGKLLNF